MSLLATINLASHTWEMPPSAAVDWYIAHLERRGRYTTVETATLYRDALEDDFIEWTNKHGNRKYIKPAVDTETASAIEYLQERGYVVTKRYN